MEAKVILFHSNESDKCKAFINNDVSLITSKKGLFSSIWGTSMDGRLSER